MSWLFGRWQRLLHSLWFRPSLIALTLGLLGVAVPQLDQQWTPDWPFLYASGPETARLLLGTLAGSLITVLALVFSLTLIAMQLVSTQLTPRALRGFLSSASTQLTAGFFIGTVLYCFLTMRHVGAANRTDGTYVPQLSVTFGLVLGIVALGVLLVFVNHVARWMQLSSITRRIALQTLSTIRSQYPRRYRDPAPPAFDPPGEQPVEIQAKDLGFVQYFALDNQGISPPREVRFLDLPVGTGEFVIEGECIARAWLTGDAKKQLAEKLRELVVIGEERDVEQDAAFGLRQLADIALRALSPGVNDPTTAVACLHYLQMLISELGQRQLGPQVDATDSCCVRRHGMNFEAYVDLAFEEILLFGAGQPRVMRGLAHALERIEAVVVEAGASRRAGYLRTLRARVLEQNPDPSVTTRARTLRAVDHS